MRVSKVKRIDHLGYGVCRSGGSVAWFDKTAGSAAAPKPHKPAESLQVDYTNRYGAGALARMICDYWHARGYTEVEAWPEQITQDKLGRTNESAMFAVRTNLVNGCPPTIRDAIDEMIEVRKAAQRGPSVFSLLTA